jgi:hypothetical protein
MEDFLNNDRAQGDRHSLVAIEQKLDGDQFLEII